MDVRSIQATLRQFAAERDWEPDHTPKNLVMALAVEVAELMEQFQWLTLGESMRLAEERPLVLDQVAAEVADVFIFLLRLCDVLGIDPEHAITMKIALNARRYPIATAKGNATKHD